MSQTNFDNLIDQHPDLAATLRLLSDWISDHPNVEFFDLRRLARDLRSITPEEIADALRIMVEEGVARRTYRVETPDNVLTDKEYESRSDVEKEESVPDSLHAAYFKPDTNKIVSGFRLE
ncbi:MAG: hypothetical protein IH991_06700 [Planctomycetes bacterium]|nr:hypothetical protein [Planctomycetota bacterium]